MLYTEVAIAALRLRDRFIRFEGSIGEHACPCEFRSVMFIDNKAVFSDPAESRACCSGLMAEEGIEFRDIFAFFPVRVRRYRETSEARFLQPVRSQLLEPQEHFDRIPGEAPVHRNRYAHLTGA